MLMFLYCVPVCVRKTATPGATTCLLQVATTESAVMPWVLATAGASVSVVNVIWPQGFEGLVSGPSRTIDIYRRRFVALDTTQKWVGWGKLPN